MNRKLGLTAFAFLLCACVIYEECTCNKMRITCRVIEITDPTLLSKESLPNKNLELEAPRGGIPHSLLFTDLIDDFNHHGDPLIDTVFYPLLGDKRFDIAVVITHGIPEPYDAWSADYLGEKSFFFNLGLWSAEDLKHSGMAVIKHEIAHILLSELLHEPDRSKPIDIIDEIVIDEGLAHFIGYPGDRSTLVSEKGDKWKAAEERLKEAKVRLADRTTNEAEIEELLYQANTGRYWDKYASIAGMFRAASIYESRGAQGLIESIQAGALAECSGSK